ncbi:MAG: transaldolase [Chloroflexota bacterium]|nr:transaldolase [Chloroflexota bacterium]
MTTASDSAALGSAIAARLAEWDAERVVERLWARDGTLWDSSGKRSAEIAAWLGWLDLPVTMGERVGELQRVAREVLADGYARAAVLGMGGSSLAPELFSRVFGDAMGAPAHGGPGLELRILDSTHPDAVRGFREWAESGRTIFCVSSKSGSTTEPNAFHAAMSTHSPALDFVAITDPGTVLAELARTQGFRAIVEGPPDVGGRYSALSVFGLLPAALHGVDLEALLSRASHMAEACHRQAADNPGLRLGAAMGEAAIAGRDKLTILTSPRLASLGDWIEQLVAESTGKAGKGIVPVVGEAIGAAEDYGPDRQFVFITTADDPDTGWAPLAAELARLGHPGMHIELADVLDIGGEFLRWEVATAMAGMILGIDPFDQPNVQEAKDATRALLDAYRRDGTLPLPAPLVAEPGMAAYGDAAVLGDQPVTVDGALGALLGTAQPGDYFALLAYLPADPGIVEQLQRMRHLVRDATGLAATLGFGPRFLHSTGQLHKGGPNTGIFLQLTADPRRDLPIPGWQETFGTLIAAQAAGDLAALQGRGRRVLRVHLADPTAGLVRLETMMRATLGEPARA